MIKFIAGHHMATKVSGTLALIIEKMLHGVTWLVPHLPWSSGFGAGSAHPPNGPSSAPRAHEPEWLSLCVEVTNDFSLAFVPSSGLLRLAWQQLGLYHDFWCGLASYSALSALRVYSEHCNGCASGGLRCQNRACRLVTIDTAPFPGCVLANCKG